MIERRTDVFVCDLLEVRIQQSAVSALATVNGLYHNRITLSVPRDSIGAAAVGDSAFFVGGEGGSATPLASRVVDVYNARSGQQSVARLSVGRENVAGVSVGRMALFAGGDVNNGSVDTTSSVVDIYDDRTQKWSTATLPRACSRLFAISVDNKAVFYGGYWLPQPGDHAINEDVFVYDTKTHQWSTRIVPGESAVAVGHQVVFGEANGVVETYDADADSWSRTTIPRVTGFLSATAVGSKAIFEAHTGPGSFDGGGIAAIYDSITGKWSEKNRPQPMGQNDALTVGVKAIFIGGYPSHNSAPRANVAVDVYDSITEKWSVTIFENFPTVHGTSLGTTAFVSYDNSPRVGIFDSRTDRFYVAPLSPNAGTPEGYVTVRHKVLIAGGLLGGDNQAADVFTDPNPAPNLVGGVGIADLSSKTARVMLNNDGDAYFHGPFMVAVYATTGAGLDRHAVLVGHVRVEHSLAPGATVQVKAGIEIPVGMKAGTYNLVAAAGPGARARMVVFGSQAKGLVLG